ncbi:conserved Plasmodium protein, unknown function [Plasmodium knowlesi strain H]|uniref:Uncharacterized protein n=3 Tax=Plasmodium knowlesi TaxID=5850 RepID=A0A5K1UVT2_PLAKH|nr:conserved Plasmodium protein, unknown function [Plasmodium knowlesi strain H]OTN63790.1 Uncharacterized protein PKNOH_S140219100 [Plasmodium knowlesi]CAA9990619.1 conserved Plasmodium protein, unknown function [Plasmodium knowlesi strain H]SBO26045.1 conserved Plasmodium protein, unknown function [Plasmodium knowlesi strain H]SBO28739.1 conserved Plasmodium protein, unknown function [Plasmodium knowlesi strain H]VVS80093.1 conserved Plasmodium protein, unknown function [Plasmodium knowlesi |eukprot:XP_002261911.1 hypothetical protein, conserved in Plasmodium species [Plasmodium knowlesi strain H]
MKTLVLNVIFVLFLVWKYNYSFAANSSMKSQMSAQNMPQVLAQQRFGRIMAETHVNQPYKEDFSIGTKAEQNSLYNTKSDDTNVYSDELKALFTKVSSIWKESIEDMEEEYYEKTQQVEKSWRENIWNNKWAKYLEHVHNTIQKKLNDLSNTPHDTEVDIAFMLSYVYKVFEMFIEEVIEDAKKQAKM